MNPTFYSNNTTYAETLAKRPESLYAKYADAIGNGKVLDVGSGENQAIERLLYKGADAYGCEVSKPSWRVKQYNGNRIPYDNEEFDAVGSYNVLEHAENPEAFISEMVRVCKPGGRIVLSSPNFLRVIGFRDYHWHMRGLLQKAANARWLFSSWLCGRILNYSRFSMMAPIEREDPQPDDDATVCTEPVTIIRELRKNGCEIISYSCCDRYVWKPLDWLLNAGPWKYLMGNCFIIAKKL